MLPKKFAERSRQPELMDDPQLAKELHHHALHGLSRVNHVTGTAKLLWKTITRHFQTPAESPLTVLDVACGGGDVAIRLADLAKKTSWPVCIQGCDISERAVQFSESQARKVSSDVTFFVRDALQPSSSAQADVVYCSLFLHHLSEPDAIRALAMMQAAAKRFVIVHDLNRSSLGYFYAWWGTRLLTRSRVCHVDGPLSVRSAFTSSEMKSLASHAGLESAMVAHHWPERLLLQWSRDEQL